MAYLEVEALMGRSWKSKKCDVDETLFIWVLIRVPPASGDFFQAAIGNLEYF
jgi:hypothetical protein